MRTRSKAAAARAGQTDLPVDFEAGLNAEQVEVVRYEGKPLRVLALAGSGKTECLARLIARLVRSGASPDRILAVTFSKKGAEEMKIRISKKFGVEGSRIGTWHSLCLQILREDGCPQASWTVEGDGPGSNPKIVLKDVLGWKGMDWKGADLSAVQNFIGRCKANLYDPSSLGADALAKEEFGWQASKALQAFQRYNDALAEKGLLSMDDFLVFAAAHLESSEEVRSSWAGRWDFGMQDEGQDANRAQKHIMWLLCRDHRNYVLIGDRNQSIYSFRGSSPEFIDQFEQEWPDGRTVVLPRNYRSGRAIITAANRIIGKAEPVPGVENATQMIGERDIEGEVRVLCAESLDDEATEITETITGSVNAGDTKLSDHTILFRTNAQSRALEEALLARRVPYVVVGGISFYERKEVRDLLAYLRLADLRGTTDDVKRSINTPFRFLGVKFVEKVMNAVDADDDEEADGMDMDWSRIIETVARGERIQDRQRASAFEWAGMLRTMQDRIAQGALAAERLKLTQDQWLPGDADAVFEAAPAQLLEYVVQTTKYIDYLNREEGGETTADSSSANVREMVRVAERFPTAAALLDYIDDTIKSARKQRDDKQAGGERVLLMSVHRSKGLEWSHVYVAGMNEMILPHVKGDEEEERRLAYVAVTRARDVLTLSYVRRIATRAGIRDVSPSRFLIDTELPLDAPREDLALGAYDVELAGALP